MGTNRLFILFAALAIALGAPADYTANFEESVYGADTTQSSEVNEIDSLPKAQPQVAAAPLDQYKQVEYHETELEAQEKQPEIDISLGIKQLNDYPPEKKEEPTSPQPLYSTLNEIPPVYPSLPHPPYPFVISGYPYVYGYPLDFRYGYAYGHAFGTDDGFVCPSDGRFYRDFGSFYNCDGGQFTVQFCAPGSRNGPPGRDPKQEPATFCEVNLVGGNLPLLLPH